MGGSDDVCPQEDVVAAISWQRETVNKDLEERFQSMMMPPSLTVTAEIFCPCQGTESCCMSWPQCKQ